MNKIVLLLIIAILTGKLIELNYKYSIIFKHFSLNLKKASAQ